jgi:hypothetical protein
MLYGKRNQISKKIVLIGKVEQWFEIKCVMSIVLLENIDYTWIR